jgi:hypothetical protein
MSASSDRTARLRYCNTEGQGKSSCCYPKLIGIDPAHNVVCLDPDCSSIITDISGQTVIVDISGQTVLVDISGQTVLVDISGQTVIVDITGQKVDISGQTVIVDISGQTVIVDITGQKVDISGQKVIVDISGQTVIADISGQTVIVDLSGQTIGATLDLSNATGDAFGRLRVSNPYTLFEYNSINGRNPLLIDEAIVGGGVGLAEVIPNTTASYIAMKVTAAGQSIIRQTHEYIMYQPGKSKLVMMSGVLSLNAPLTGVISRIGCFDSEMGIFIQRNGTAMSVVKRYNSVDIEVINQISWSENQLTGLDFSKAQLFIFDFEWLGVGQVRCGMMINGVITYYHTFNHYNALIAPYIPMGKLPMRYEISSTGGAGEMRMMAGTALNEGTFVPIGRYFTFGSFTNAQIVNVTTTVGFKPIIAIRLRSTGRFKRSTVKIKDIELFNTTVSTWGSWQLILNPTISTPPTWIDVDATNESAVQGSFDISTKTVSGGTILYTNYYSTRVGSIINTTTTDELISSFPITTGLNDIPDTVVLVANNLSTGGGGGAAADILAYIKWFEFI